MEPTKIWKTGLVNLPDLEDNQSAESKSEAGIPYYVRRGGGGLTFHGGIEFTTRNTTS